jgi:hypothetical protein
MIINLRLVYQMAEYTSHNYDECTLGPNFIYSIGTTKSSLRCVLLVDGIGIFLVCILVRGLGLVGRRRPNPSATSFLSLLGKFCGGGLKSALLRDVRR